MANFFAKVNIKSLFFKFLFVVGIAGIGLSQFSNNEGNLVPVAHAKTPAKQTNNKTAQPKKKNSSSKGSVYQSIKWDNLLPKDDLTALQVGPSSPPSILDGSSDDKIASPLSMKIAKPKDAYEKALISVKVVDKYNKKKIKLPGFIVPIDIEGEGVTKTFFFVPFFGACLHLPPPPPNQIVYATYSKGYQVKDLYQPFYIEATLYTKQTQNDLATSAYSAVVDKIYEYE